jgi:predicted dehydrogenase
MCEIVRNRRIGELKRIEVLIGPNHKTAPEGAWKPTPVPDWLDYDMWLGPAPWKPYHPDRCLYKFRFIWDYSGGNVTNLGAHSFDLAQCGAGTDDTGPVEIEDLGGEFPADGLFDVATKVHFRMRYANGVEMFYSTSYPYVRFEGTEGWIQANYSGPGAHLTAEPQSILKSAILPGEIHLPLKSEKRDFVDCVKTRRPTVADAEVGHRTNSLCHLGHIAIQLGRKLKWDPRAERFVGDTEADRMLTRPMRSPWRL